MIETSNGANSDEANISRNKVLDGVLWIFATLTMLKVVYSLLGVIFLLDSSFFETYDGTLGGVVQGEYTLVAEGSRGLLGGVWEGYASLRFLGSTTMWAYILGFILYILAYRTMSMGILRKIVDVFITAFLIMYSIAILIYFGVIEASLPFSLIIWLFVLLIMFPIQATSYADLMDRRSR